MGKEEENRHIRLNKFLSRCGICSRRRADELIASGRVAVGGHAVSQLGLRIDPEQDRVSVDGEPVRASGGDRESHVYLAMHKPVRVLTTLSDPQQRSTIVDLLPSKHKHQRILPAGRLDYLSEGLLLLSTDGDFLNRITHPRYHLPKTYQLKIRGTPARDKLEAVRRGMRLTNGEDLAPVPVEVLESRGKGIYWLQLTLRQGINRQIRRMCHQLDWTVLRLIRTAQGPVELGGLEPGSCRDLRSDEIRELLRPSSSNTRKGRTE